MPHGRPRNLSCVRLASVQVRSALMSAAATAISHREVFGVDFDQRIVEIARQSVAQLGLRVSFRALDVEKEELDGGPYDFVYARFLLSHLQTPEAAIRRMHAVLRPGGTLAVEDVDFRGHFCHPESPAFQRYVELYTQAGVKRGVAPLIGPRLPE